MHINPFSDAELARRIAAIRHEIATRGLDVAVFSAPESVFYLTGLDHWGYFAPHFLIVPVDGDMVLITREVERVTVEHQVRNARFLSHSDSERAEGKLIGWLTEQTDRLGSPSSDGHFTIKLRVGIEEQAAGLSAKAAASLRTTVLGASFADITGLSDRLRRVKSPEEQALMRAAASASDAGMAAAIAAIHDGAREVDVAAECLAAMTRAGSHPPGFGPFIRPEARISEEYTTWGDGVYRKDERVMIEVAGCASRYHAPLGRLVYLGMIRDEDAAMAEIAKSAFQAILEALKPGVRARDVYAAWQGVVDAAGMPDYRRHHCGYLVGIGVPPSWTGGNAVTGLRPDSDLTLETGMTFHAMSWFIGTGRGEFFASDCVLLGADGAELLTHAPFGPILV